jgi:hypothetical protein
VPCDTIQESSVELKNPNIKLLMDALTALGLQPVHDASRNYVTFRGGYYSNGELTVQGRYRTEAMAQKIKIEYSKSIVNFAAKQFGWAITENTTAQKKKGVAASFNATKR